MIREAPPQSAASPETARRIQAWRAAASEHSGGASSDSIYTVVERVLLELRASGDVLDFGAGVGLLSRRLLRTGWARSVTATDLLPRPRDLPDAIKWVDADLNAVTPLAAASFDVVVAVEVVEHLENPRATARELFRLLRPGGLVLVSTPNNESWRALIALAVRGHFVSFGDSSYPAHITALVRSDLQRVLCEAGFTAPAFTFTDIGGLPGCPSRTWQSLLGRRACGLRFSDNVVVTARKPTILEQ